MSQANSQVRASGVAVDRDNPWPGLAPFTEAQREFFFGREEETAELLRRVRGKMLTVLFGQSGLGKTSLLAAGLSPKLREEDMIPIQVRLNHDPLAPSLADQVRNVIGQTIQSKRMDGPMPAAGQTLWEYFHQRDLELWTPRNRPAAAVIIFDQFEEIYTLGRTNEQTRQRGREFSQELADLVENRPPAALRQATEDAGDEAAPARFDFSGAPCKVLLSLREDYLPDLEGYRKLAPSIADNRLRLQLMNGRQALHVLCSAGGHLIDRATALRVVRFVGGASEAGDPAEMEAGLEGLRIEPALLSIFAHELNRKRQAMGLERITADLLEGHRDQIIGDFYERSLADLPPHVRPFIEDRLLTPSGYRDSLAMEIATGPGGLSAELIDQLVARRLLHVDQRLGTQRLELTHDVLTGPVRTSRDSRQQGQAIKLAQEREREIAAKLARARKRLMVTSALAVVMLALAVFSYLSWQKSLRETARAEAARIAAEKSAGLATSSIEHTLMTLDWDEAVTVLSSMTSDTHSANTAEILQALAEKYRRAGRRTEEIRARLWLAHADPQAGEPWMAANADELATLLTGLLARSDDANWQKLEDFFSPAELAICGSLVRTFPELAARGSRAEMRAAVSIGLHAHLPLWSPAKGVVLITANADALKKLMLEVMVDQDKARWKDIVGFFEPARDVILGRVTDAIADLVGTEDVNDKRLEAAIFFGERPRTAADSTQQASVHTDTQAELSLGNPVERAINAYRQSRLNVPEPDPKDLLARGLGAYTSEFAFCQSLPLNDALKLTAILRKNKYQLRSFRPYNTATGEIRVTARWDSGPAEGSLRMDLTLDQARDQERQMFLEGYVPEDLTCYEVRGANGQSQERIALVCRKMGPIAPRYRLFLNVPEADVRDNINKVIGAGFDIVTAQLVRGPDGDQRFYGIATTDPKYQSSITRWEVKPARVGQQPAEGLLEVVVDVRPQTRFRPDLKLWWQRALAESSRLLQADSQDVKATLQKAEALLHLGRNKESIEVLSSKPVDPQSPGQSALYWRAIVRARIGDTAGAQEDLQALAKLRDPTSASLPYLSGLIAICAGKPVPPEVDKLAGGQTAGELYNAACVYAWAAGQPQRPADEREKLAARAVEILRQGIKVGVDDSYGAWIDSDLQALQTRPDFALAMADIPVNPLFNVTFLSVLRGVAIDDLVKVQQGTATEILQNAKIQADARQTLTTVAMFGDGAGASSVALWAPAASADVAGVTSARAETFQTQLKASLRKSLEYEKLTDTARKWWDAFERTNERNQSLVLEIMQSLDARKGTIQEFYRAYLYSKAYNLRANLYFLDYVRTLKAFRTAGQTALSPDCYAAFARWMTLRPLVKVTDVRDWKPEQIQAQIKVDKDFLKFSGASADARTWWGRLEADNVQRPALVLRLLEEIGARNQTSTCLDDLFEAAADAHCDDLLAQLQFLDYLNSKRTYDAQNGASPGTAPSAMAALLNTYARRRLLGLPPPPLPATADKMLTTADLDAALTTVSAGLEDCPGVASPDMVYYVSTACSALISDALSRGVVPDLPATALRLAKAAYYNVDEKDITVYLTVNLPAEASLNDQGKQALAKAREKITLTYKDEIFKTIADNQLGDYAGNDFYRQHLPNHLERLFQDLRSAYWLNDLRKAGELLEELRPAGAAVQAVLADDVPADALRQILAQRPPTPDEVGQHGLFGAMLDVRASHTSFVQLRNNVTIEPIVKYLKPGTEFYQVELGANKVFYLVFWDGSAWKMLNPLWEIPEFQPAPAR